MSGATVQYGGKPHDAALVSALDALRRAWETLSLYGEDHAAFEYLVKHAAKDMSRVATRSPVSVRVTPDAFLVDGGHESTQFQGGGLARALHGLEIASLRIDGTVSVRDLARWMKSVSEESLPERAGGLSTLRMCYGEIGDGASTKSVDLRSWDNIVLAIESPGALGASSPQDALLHAVAGQGSSNPAKSLADAIHAGQQEDGSEGLARIREVISQMSPVAQRRLVRGAGEQGALEPSDVAALAEALPVEVTCRILKDIDAREMSLSDASLRLFRRLAGLAGGNASDLSVVAERAREIAGVEGGRDGDVLRSISELCSEASSHEFTPEDYQARLDAIASEGALSLRGNGTESQSREKMTDTVHAAEIALRVNTVELGASIEPGLLERLEKAVGPAVTIGRIDVLISIAEFGFRLQAHPDNSLRASGQELGALATAPESISRSISACEDSSLLESVAESLQGLLREGFAEVVMLAASDSPSDAACAFIRNLVDRGDINLSRKAALELASVDPGSVRFLAESLEGEDDEFVFDIVRRAIESTTPDRLPSILEAVARTGRDWPATLAKRALMDDAIESRKIAARHIVGSQTALMGLLADRLMGRIGKQLPCAEESELLCEGLLEADRSRAVGRLRRARRILAFSEDERGDEVLGAIEAALRELGDKSGAFGAVLDNAARGSASIKRTISRIGRRAA